MNKDEELDQPSELSFPKLREEAPPETMASKWKQASFRWARGMNGAYFSNPAARRDFRVQFRGKGAIVVFALAVLLFGGVALYMFDSVSRVGLTPADIQENLSTFCTVMLMILGTTVGLIAPALASASILVEKQRRSLDLVFTSPIKPKHYLFGKLIASYRYVWVLMAISLPFTAMSVIMGGGSWLNILEAYFLLSLQGLLFTSIGIYFSSLVEKTLSALLFTYFTVVALCVTAFSLSVAIGGAFLMSPTPFQGGQAPLSASFVPILVEYATGTFTTLFGIPIPNTLIALLVTGGAVNYILSAAGGLLSPLKNKERSSLRIQSALILAAVTGFVGFFDPSNHIVEGAVIPPALANDIFFLLSTLPLLFFIPFLSCYAPDAERRQAHSQLFRFRDLFGKSVAGALPYLYSVLGLCSLSFLAGSVMSTHAKIIDGSTIAHIVFAFGFWTFVWATARFSSSFLKGIKAARTLQLLTFAGVVGIPLPFFIWISSQASYGQDWLLEVWKFNPISPFLYRIDALPTCIHALLFFMIGGVMAFWSEKNYQRRSEARKIARMAEETPVSSTSNLENLGAIAEDEELMQRLVQGR